MADSPDWQGALGIAAMAMMQALIERLRQRGIFDRQDGIAVIDNALLYVEAMDASYPSETTHRARIALQTMMEVFDENPPPPSSA